MTVSIALRQSSVIDVQKSLFIETVLSDRTVKCKIKLVIWRYAVSEVLKKYKEEKVKFDGEMCIKSFLTKN